MTSPNSSLAGTDLRSPEEEYKDSFGLGTPPDPQKSEKALTLALDIRKFEIGLYWQRTAYFWALIAAAFAPYFAILGAEHLEDKEFLACTMNIGSKKLLREVASTFCGAQPWSRSGRLYFRKQAETGTVSPISPKSTRIAMR
jgi:hypothetical protein